MSNLSKQVYIPSIQACDIYSHMYQEGNLDLEYIGMIPHSLELIKLRKVGLDTFSSRKHPNKILSNDIINVKFSQKVKSAKELIKIVNKKLISLDDEQMEYKQKLKQYLKQLKLKVDDPNWQEVKSSELRSRLYDKGFTITIFNKDGELLSQNEYVVYKRSSAKSRTGQCLFIKKHLHDEMINWSRMYLPLKENMKIDLASLLAYESLVGSSIEDTIKINPDNILLIDDVESKFTQTANVVRKGEDGYLDSVTEETSISNSLFDGQSLLDSRYFSNSKGMMLLRNHMFKSAAFNTNIQQFLKDNCPDDIKYDEWQITDMYGNKLFAKDIHMITTPNSLKALKFSDVMGTENDMYNHWKQIVKQDGCLFGIVKHEEESRHGELQQTSYQMLNSLPLDRDSVKELSEYEREYIEKLKNDDDFFIQHIDRLKNEVNSNEMFAELYQHNKKIVHTKVFRDFRKQVVRDHVNYVKKGKIRLKGDYCVMLGNPIEFLYHAIGKLDVNICQIHNQDIKVLKGNEIYTTLHNFNKELVGFRNPHTSPSNVLVAKNTYNALINKYFNLTENIVCVNAINFPLQDILSGSDYDSDTVLLFDGDNNRLLDVAKQCGQYHVCINNVDSQKKEYRLNNADMCEIDNQLATSQDNIGVVVNLGQLCMSRYWDLMSEGNGSEEINELIKLISIMTILSGICIDLAKKFYEIDIEQEVKNVNDKLKLKNGKNPLFWVNVSKNDNAKNKITEYNCPMDYLNDAMSNLGKANYRENIKLDTLLNKERKSNANRKQKAKLELIINELKQDIGQIERKGNLEGKEKFNKIADVTNHHLDRIGKFKVKPATMYDILSRIETEYKQIAQRLMNALYRTQRETFLSGFKKSQL